MHVSMKWCDPTLRRFILRHHFIRASIIMAATVAGIMSYLFAFAVYVSLEEHHKVRSEIARRLASVVFAPIHGVLWNGPVPARDAVWKVVEWWDIAVERPPSWAEKHQHI